MKYGMGMPWKRMARDAEDERSTTLDNNALGKVGRDSQGWNRDLQATCETGRERTDLAISTIHE
jgi:hypothetical protein